ncbi:hypothetical protein SHIRM173S_00710 [Streptomyces hirsutus]
MSTVHSRAIRPGLDDSSTTRCASRTASRTLCVTNRTDTRVSRQIRVSSSCSTSRVMASSAANGSSISSSLLSWASARASATRWRIPPDSSCTRLPWAPPSRTSSSSSSARPRRSAFGTPRSFRASSMFLPAVSHGNSACSWNISAGRPSVLIAPALGASRPATRLSSVDLPQPEAPSRVTNSPGATSSVMSSSTSCCPAGPANDFETCSIRAAWVAASVPSAALARVVAMVVTSWDVSSGFRDQPTPRPASSTAGAPSAARTLLRGSRS